MSGTSPGKTGPPAWSSPKFDMPSGYSNATGLPIGLMHKKQPFRWLWVKLKIRARVSGLVCTLTFDEFLSFVDKKTCHYCGAKLPWEPHASTLKTSSSYFLDRINNNQGYTAANCVPCCTICNKTRSNIFTHEEMLKIGPFVREIVNQRNGLPNRT